MDVATLPEWSQYSPRPSTWTPSVGRTGRPARSRKSGALDGRGPPPDPDARAVDADGVARNSRDGLRQGPHALRTVLAAGAPSVRPVPPEAADGGRVGARRDEVSPLYLAGVQRSREVKAARQARRRVDADPETGGHRHRTERDG